MFNSVEAPVIRGESIGLKVSVKVSYLLPSQFCLVSSDGHKYGTFGTDLIGRKPVTIQIGNGDVIAQATSSFIYGTFSDKLFKSVECFSFYVSNET